MAKNGRPASPASALASSVLPVPGGPQSRMPDGIVAPTRSNRSGLSRKSSVSRSSSTASSQPATSVNLTADSSTFLAVAATCDARARRCLRPTTIIVSTKPKSSLPTMANGTNPSRRFWRLPPRR